jgi:hypothetical protein
MKGNAKKVSKKVTKEETTETKKKSSLGLYLVSAIFAVCAILGGLYVKNKGQLFPSPTAEQNDQGVYTYNDELVTESNVPKGANVEGKPREAIKDCIDRHAECPAFMKQGECSKNPGWMIINCPKSCNPVNNACALRDPKVRCQRTALNISTEPVYKVDDMDKMFSNIVSRFGNRYEINILSEAPWVVTFENFISDEEADALVKTVPRWERSTDTGSMNEYGESGRVLSTGRTSSNGWCTGDCEKVSQ